MTRAPYDDGYAQASCLWGVDPASYLKLLLQSGFVPENRLCLDVGCGEGKNSAFLAAGGARVLSVDISLVAIFKAIHLFPGIRRSRIAVADVGALRLGMERFDLVLCYGLLHCLASSIEINETIARLQLATKPGGYHVLCAFNERFQDLRAHPGFVPTLLTHSEYLERYADWRLVAESDVNLVETHPHNGIEHTHSLTRLIARKIE